MQIFYSLLTLWVGNVGTGESNRLQPDMTWQDILSWTHSQAYPKDLHSARDTTMAQNGFLKEITQRNQVRAASDGLEQLIEKETLYFQLPVPLG